MAPPHTAKNTSTTSAKSTSRRSGHNFSVQKHNLERFENGSITEHDEQAEEMDTDAAGTLDTSQHAPSVELQKMMANMVDDQRKRHQFRKQSVNKSYIDARTATQESITTLFTEHEAKSSEVYNAQLRRLEELIKKKEEIEEAMKTKVIALRKNYNTHSNLLRKVIEHHVEGLR